MGRRTDGTPDESEIERSPPPNGDGGLGEREVQVPAHRSGGVPGAGPCGAEAGRDRRRRRSCRSARRRSARRRTGASIASGSRRPGAAARAQPLELLLELEPALALALALALLELLLELAELLLDEDEKA